MDKQIRIVKKGKDNSNISYWVSRSYVERMAELEKMRQQVNRKRYGARQGLQRVYQITKRT